MKIDNPLLAQVSTGALQQSGSVADARTSGAGGGNSGPGSDRVQISSLSAALRDLQVEDPDRTAKVDAIAKAVESGGYGVDASALSRKIVEEFTSAS